MDKFGGVDKMVRPPAYQFGSGRTEAQGRIAKFESGPASLLFTEYLKGGK